MTWKKSDLAVFPVEILKMNQGINGLKKRDFQTDLGEYAW